MKRILSGIKPSGEVTLGNYLGAMKRWSTEQKEGDEHFYFVPNLHALTTLRDAEKLQQHTLGAVSWLLVLGIDPAKTTIYVQSQIPAHSEMAWILNNFVTMGELSRMTQYKDKSKKVGVEGQLVGLFDYPVLMAADILLYDADEVPVGHDQAQHVELARDIAKRFNNQIDQIFKLPKATVQEVGARIMNLQKPKRKMSASDTDQSGVILLNDPSKTIKEKIMVAVTDSGKEIKYDTEKKPALSNLLQIYSSLSDKSIEDLEKRYKGKGYGVFKEDLADIVVGALVKLQEKHNELMADEKNLLAILDAGRAKAEAIADKKLNEVKAKLGLL